MTIGLAPDQHTILVRGVGQALFDAVGRKVAATLEST